MDDQRPSMKSLNDLLYDNDLSIEELEERLEMSSVWICVTQYCSENSGPPPCSPVVGSPR